VLVLRRTRPDLPRPFRAPAAYFTCIVGALICFAMMVFLGVPTWIRLLVWTAIGVVVYMAYGRKHSRVRNAMHGGSATGTRPATLS
jgi:APA family basic amino acid/polyamine antiporter